LLRCLADRLRDFLAEALIVHCASQRDPTDEKGKERRRPDKSQVRRSPR
jgi:hypothetical protein